MAILLLFLLLILVFSIPSVQTFTANKVTQILYEKYDAKIDVENVSISYDGRVVLDQVFIADHHQDTLISAKELKTSLLNIPGLLTGYDLDFANAEVNQLKLHVKRYKGEERDNLNIFSEKFNSGKPKTSDFSLTIDHIQVLDGTFTFVDENNDIPNLVHLNNLNINAYNLLVDNSDVYVDINSLNGMEARGIPIKNLQTKFSYTSKLMRLKDLSLKTEESSIVGDLKFKYKDPEDFSDFENEVQLEAKLQTSSISTNDLTVFYEEFGKEKTFTFEGNISGTLNDLNLENWHMRGMDRSVIDGNLNLKNMLAQDPSNFVLEGDFNQLSTNYYDLVNLLPRVLGNTLPRELIEIGNINLSGYIKATPTTISTNSRVNSQLGNAILKVDLGALNDPDFATYKGNVVFKDFNLGRLLGYDELGKTSFNLKVDGTGFNPNTLNTKLNGNIEKLRFNAYTYKNIKVSGTLKNPYFNGNLVIDDPNLQFDFNGLIDVSEEQNVYDFNAHVAYADLYRLNFVNRDTLAIFKGNVEMNMRGTTIDDAEGEILLKGASYKNQNTVYNFEEFIVTSSFKEEVRKITINSPDIISGEVVGKFNLREVPALFKNSIGNLYANYEPIPIESNQYLDFNFDIYNKIVEVVSPDVKLSSNTFIRGSVESEEDEFKLTFKSPEMEIFKNKLEEINVQIDNSNPLFNAYVEVDSISTKFYNASKFNLINVTLRDTLFVRTEFKGGENNDDDFNLSFYHTINEDNKSVVGFRKSNFKFKEAKWYLNQKNLKNQKLVFDNEFKTFELDTLLISHKNELIKFSGELTDSTYKNFHADFSQVDLKKITPYLDSLDLGGIVNGELNFLQKKGVYYPSSSLNIKNVSINDTDYGNLDLSIEGNKSLTSYQIDVILKNEEYEFLKAKGGINVSAEDSNIDLVVDLDKFKLDAFSALGGDVISNIRGEASGQAKISGDYSNPDISGRLTLEKAGAKIPYLNVDLDFEQNAIVDLSNQEFLFNKIDVTDVKYKTKGVLNGTISHQKFSKWELDLSINAPDRLLVLDTEATEESLYYGTGFINGSASIKGPTDELKITVNAKTEKGTIFKIPLNDTETIGDNSFIYFLTREEKIAREQGKEIETKPVKGLELVFDLDVTNDAEVEIVVDQNSGSSLRGRGAGTILIEINTNGKFNMWGDFVAYEGVYNFKYGGLVQKEFQVVSGGNLTWDGSPTRANLNVRAMYETSANPAILLENPTINRNIPVEVFINLEGELTEADLSFDIEYPNLSSVVKSELEYRISDRQSTELQALSLITQGSFYSQNAPGQNAAPGNLLIERASGLFDDIFSDEDGKFKVGINYVQGARTQDQDVADRFGITLSTQISKRILLNGRVGVPVGGVTESVVVGNVEIDLLLNEDGTLRAKLFNRENNIQYIGEQLGYTQGVGLSYSVDFDTFKELIRKMLNQETEKEKKIPEEVEENPKSLAPDYIQFPGID
ncbi:translocation/assembly module TamB domain-containing protein [Mesonia ostreae]|uniref:Translocation/assembly module TamB domain-containing protein n=1 Tax=Mesonia ostreae TaxID=861110 RepID=A0ABU2KI16_9FLAO|nr:translocation/assembly module TamB domain-containing protein [Mesonia ostreae]MDT0294362.1 translocation/assembly module TamB domain-containing protein [Mesonia ostreae]